MPATLARLLACAEAAYTYVRLLGRDALTASERSTFRWILDQACVDEKRRPINPDLEDELRECSDAQATRLFDLLGELQAYTDPDALEPDAQPDPAGREGVAATRELFGITLEYKPQTMRRNVQERLDLLVRLLGTVQRLQDELAGVVHLVGYKTVKAALRDRQEGGPSLAPALKIAA